MFVPRQPTLVAAPTDFSEESEAGISHAAMLARAFDARLVLVVNLNLPERAHLEPLAAAWEVDVTEAGRHFLTNMAARLAPDLAVETIVTEHDRPADGVLWAVEEAGADLVVVASHGRSGVGRWLLGSVADRLVHAARVPVLVVPMRTS